MVPAMRPRMSFFQFCVDRDWIARNPAKALTIRQPRLTPTLPYTDEEMVRLIAACDRYRGNRDRMRAFVLTIRYSGLRILVKPCAPDVWLQEIRNFLPAGALPTPASAR
jgi:hypothetical protein